MQALGLFCLFFIGLYFSTKQRKYLLMRRDHVKSSPFSSAIAQLVGTAGGIYISLELLFSFLKLPDQWLTNSSLIVEPLATISLLLAIIQPFVLRLWLKIRKYY